MNCKPLSRTRTGSDSPRASCFSGGPLARRPQAAGTTLRLDQPLAPFRSPCLGCLCKSLHLALRDPQIPRGDLFHTPSVISHSNGHLKAQRTRVGPSPADAHEVAWELRAPGEVRTWSALCRWTVSGLLLQRTGRPNSAWWLETPLQTAPNSVPWFSLQRPVIDLGMAQRPPGKPALTHSSSFSPNTSSAPCPATCSRDPRPEIQNIRQKQERHQSLTWGDIGES